MANVPGLINPQQAYERGLGGWIRLRIRLIRRRLRGWAVEAGDFLRRPMGVLGLASVLLFAFLAVGQPLLMATVWEDAIYDPEIGFDFDFMPHPSLPSSTHLLGTDPLGRDVLSLLAFATQTSFGVGLVAGLVGTVIATAVGVTAAYYEGKVDTVLMTISDTFVLLPPAVVLLIVGLIFDMNWLQVGLIFGIFAGLGSLAILVKSQALTIKSKQYIEASKVSGRGGWRIIRTHMLPNLASLLSVNAMFIVTGSVLIEALLSFLQRTQLRVSWGLMIWQALRNNMSLFSLKTEWHTIVPPAFAIMLFCGGFYLIGRTLDEVTNPRLRAP
jgi:peptide/nickel transport system permease protein